MLTDSQFEILHVISRFGYVDCDFLQTYFNVKQPTIYNRLKRLENKKFIIGNNKILDGYKNKKIYFLTEKSRKIFNVPPVNFRFSTYKHDMLVARVMILLCKKNKDLQPRFETEREIRSRLGFGTKEHVPDGILYFVRDGKKLTVALEIETTKKKKETLKKNFDFYYTMSKYNLIWYYCNDLTINWVKKNNKYEKIKVLHLDKILKFFYLKRNI
jgi:hypothetical protein